MRISTQNYQTAGACYECQGRLNASGTGLVYPYPEVLVIQLGSVEVRLCPGHVAELRQRLRQMRGGA